MRLQIAAGLFVLAVAVGGCYASAGGGYYAPAPAYGTVSVSTYEQPDLVEISPGVQVVYDYNEPIFYSDNYYWRFDNGVWYRSTYYNSGFVVYNDVPYHVRSIDRPYNYRHYRPANYQPRVRDHRTQPAYREQPTYQPQPTVRDHRTYQPAPAPQPTVRDHRTYQPAPSPAPAPQPVVRDHRTYQPAPAPAPAPAPRDHRGNGNGGYDNRDKKNERDHRH